MPQDIVAFFERYRDAFNALDGHAVAQLYAQPCGIAQDGVYTHWPTRADVAANMVALCKLYRDKGFARAGFELTQWVDQGRQHAVADLLWRIEWDNGQEPWRFKTSYNLMRAADAAEGVAEGVGAGVRAGVRAGGWQVLLCTAYSEAALHR